MKNDYFVIVVDVVLQFAYNFKNVFHRFLYAIRLIHAFQVLERKKNRIYKCGTGRHIHTHSHTHISKWEFQNT